MDDDAIRTLLRRLGRRDPGGGLAIERSAVLAEGSDCAEIEAWIVAHGGVAEGPAPVRGRGLHADRTTRAAAERAPVNVRYVLPPGALDS
jgi:hypothetical protein